MVGLKSSGRNTDRQFPNVVFPEPEGADNGTKMPSPRALTLTAVFLNADNVESGGETTNCATRSPKSPLRLSNRSGNCSVLRMWRFWVINGISCEMNWCKTLGIAQSFGQK